MSRFLRRWFAPIHVTINLPESIIMAIVDDIKTQIADINTKVDALIADASTPDASAAELAAQNVQLADVSASLQALDVKVAAQLNAAVAPPVAG